MPYTLPPERLKYTNTDSTIGTDIKQDAIHIATRATCTQFVY